MRAPVTKLALESSTSIQVLTMRVLSLAVLALASSLDIVAAGRRCTPTPKVVKNVVVNGGLTTPAGLSGPVPAFTVGGGDIQILAGKGYSGGGNSGENDCAGVTVKGQVPSPGRKRAVEDSARLSQTLNDLEPGTDYTVRFYYYVVSNTVAGVCSMISTLGATQFDQTVFNAVVSDSASSSWVPILASVPISSTSADLSIVVTCNGGGSLVVYIDQIFVSNQVTPQNIDSFTIDWGYGSLTTSTPTLSVGSSSTTSTTTSTTSACTEQCFLSSPVPDSARCGASGTPSPTPYAVPRSTYPKQDKLEDCAVICDERAGCKALAYDASSTAAPCRFITETILEGGFDYSAASGLNWYDLACFKCSGCDTSSSSSSSTTVTPTTTTSHGTTSTTGCPNGVAAPGACYDATPTASGSQCYKYGDVQVQPYTCSETDCPDQYRIEQCAFYCQLDADCKAVGYNYLGFPTACRFLDVSLAEGGFAADSGSTVEWFDIGCYTCYNCPVSSSSTTPRSTPTPVVQKEQKQ